MKDEPGWREYPKGRDSAWAKAHWFLRSCLLQPMLFVTPSSTQTLMGTWLLPFQALSLQALAFVFQADYWWMPPLVVGTLLVGFWLLLVFPGTSQGGRAQKPRATDYRMLHPVHQDDLKIILFYTLIFPFADEGIGAQSCKHEEEFPRKREEQIPRPGGGKAGLCRPYTVRAVAGISRSDFTWRAGEGTEGF